MRTIKSSLIATILLMSQTSWAGGISFRADSRPSDTRARGASLVRPSDASARIESTVQSLSIPNQGNKAIKGAKQKAERRVSGGQSNKSQSQSLIDAGTTTIK